MNMKSKTLQITVVVLLVMAIIAACSDAGSNDKETKKDDISTIRKKEKDELIARGKYLVTVSGCNDCHSPKIMTPMGPIPDTTRLMSGYPSEKGIPTLSEALAKDQSWVKMSHDVTAFAGPWRMTFGANLTPDEATGIGNWTEEVFVKTIRTGKHLGQEGGRPVMPPIPWYMIAKMTDEDLSSVYQYLMSLPAISNRVPAAIPPNEIKITKQ
jgi:mono/diheme cytochrome c family protein